MSGDPASECRVSASLYRMVVDVGALGCNSGSVLIRFGCVLCYFFFQAEDGIRDIGVTGVQTCALPICIWAESEGIGRGNEREPQVESASAPDAFAFSPDASSMHLHDPPRDGQTQTQT